jgi:hypothetical protein
MTRLKCYITGSLLFLACAACDTCKLLHGEERLGSNFTFVNEDKSTSYILYCYDIPGSKCCDSGITVVPTYVENTEADENWIIARSIKDNKDKFWIIKKNFEVDLANCEQVKCDSVIRSNVLGPMGLDDFNSTKRRLGITLDISN